VVGKGLGVERAWWWQKTGARVIGMNECLGRFDDGFDLEHGKRGGVMEYQGELGDCVSIEEAMKLIETEG
jgi:hypothetical protein